MTDNKINYKTDKTSGTGAVELKDKPYNGVVYRSEMYAKNCKGMLPFRIEIEEKNRDGQRELWIKKIEYNVVGDRTIVEEKLVMSSFFREEA